MTRRVNRIPDELALKAGYPEDFYIELILCYLCKKLQHERVSLWKEFNRTSGYY